MVARMSESALLSVFFRESVCLSIWWMLAAFAANFSVIISMIANLSLSCLTLANETPYISAMMAS